MLFGTMIARSLVLGLLLLQAAMSQAPQLPICDPTTFPPNLVSINQKYSTCFNKYFNWFTWRVGTRAYECNKNITTSCLKVPDVQMCQYLYTDVYGHRILDPNNKEFWVYTCIPPDCEFSMRNIKAINCTRTSNP